MWGTLISGAIGGLGALFGGKKEAKGIKQATGAALAQVQQGRDAVAGSELNTTFAPGGARAFDTALGALGAGTPEQNANAGTAFQTFRDSAGYGAQLEGGIDALDASASAKGMRNSGANQKAAIRFGQGLGAQHFNNYLSQLMGASQQGLQASSAATGIEANLAGVGAKAALGGGAASAEASGNAISDLGGIIGGTVADIWGKG